MLLLKISAVCCLLVSAKGYTLDFEEQFPSINDAKYYDEDNYDVIEWDFMTTRKQHHVTYDHDHGNDSSTEATEEDFDSWSIVWYIASFGGLIAFFLVVSCSEWCCRKHVRENQTRTVVAPTAPSPTFESPPPAYDLFAPPSYESVTTSPANEKNEFDIFVVPVHAIGSLVQNTNSQQEENPPSYTSISIQGSGRTASTT